MVSSTRAFLLTSVYEGANGFYISKEGVDALLSNYI